MKFRRFAIVFGLFLVLAAVLTVHSLRSGSFSTAAGFNPLAVDSVRVQAADGTARVVTCREDLLELVACLNSATYEPSDSETPATDGEMTLIFCRGGRPVTELQVGKQMVVDGRVYTVRGLNIARLRVIAGFAA